MARRQKLISPRAASTSHSPKRRPGKMPLTRKRALSTDVGEKVTFITEEQLEKICDSGQYDKLGQEILRQHYKLLTDRDTIARRERKSQFFSGLGLGMFRKIVKKSSAEELTEDLKDFNATVGVIVALMISFAYAFNLGDIEADERNLFALCGEDQFADNRLSIGQMILGVLNFLLLIVCIAVLIFTCRAYFFLSLLPQNITRVFVELVGPQLFLDLTQILLAVAFWLLYFIIAFYALVVFPWWLGIPLVVVQLIGIILHSACVINIDQKFFTAMLLSGMSLEEPGESGQSAVSEAVVETRKM